MDRGLETKIAGGVPDSEIAGAFGDMMRAFEAFKDTNDERLGEIERRMSDVVTTDKLERIGQALDRQKATLDALTLKARRPQIGGSDETKAGVAGEHKQAFNAYVRKGETQALLAIEQKALSVGSDPDGGYLVPDEIETEIGRLLKDVSPIRSIAALRQVSSSVYKKPFAISGAATGWVGETAARPQTAAPTLAELQFPAMELYAMPASTQSLLDDSAVNIDEWLAEEVQQAFADQESEAFISGNGTNKPKGFLAYTKVADDEWSWGNIGYIATGVDGGFAASSPSDRLIDLVYSMKAGYCPNAAWVMNRKTQSVIRKFKDLDGNYLWQPAQGAAGKATLMGFPVVEAAQMPDIASDAYAIAFGDFRRGYLIVDRLGVRILRDPYSAKPYVLFYTTKRVGGGVQNFEAIKLLKFGED
jgi:HK97 family phage major capsid protein